MEQLAELRAEHARILLSLKGIEEAAERGAAGSVAAPPEKMAAQALALLRALEPAVRLHQAREERVVFPGLLRAAPGEALRFEILRRVHGDITAALEETVSALEAPGPRPPSWILLQLMRLRSIAERQFRREEELVAAVGGAGGGA